jgi:hypothetical protein
MSKIGEGDTVKLNKYFGNDIKQIDYITSLLKQFNLMIVQDNTYSNRFIIETFDTYFNVNFGVVDWTNKLDNSNAIEVTSPTTYNELYMHYTEDEDRLNKEYKNKYNKIFGEYKDKYDRLGETNELTSIFSPTPLYNYYQSNIICPHLYRVNDQGETEKENISAFKPRLLFADKIVGNNGQWGIESYANLGTLWSIGSFYPYVGHLDNPDTETMDLNFGQCDIYFNTTYDNFITSNNIFNKYYRYSQYLYFGAHAKKLVAKFKLNQQDISQLDFRKLIYIDKTYYILSSINNYTSNNLISCELIRYTPYKLPVIIHKPIIHVALPAIAFPKPFPVNPNANISDLVEIISGTRNSIIGNTNSNIINGIDSTINNAHDVLLLNTRNITVSDEASNKTYIGQTAVLQTDPVVSPDIIDGGLNNILNTFGCSVFNLIDSGENTIRPIGSFVITQLFDGNR